MRVASAGIRCAVVLCLSWIGTTAHAESDVEQTRWQRTIERVSESIVTLRIRSPRAFDDQEAGYSTATGFVVDAEQGLILTNRHLVTAGPVVAEAVFLDNEEVELRAVYRDPVHDFGVFRFDPRDVKFMPVRALALAPERARVGTEIRVIGNDAGEKLSILGGTLARLDRDAPPYGRESYNDFNTFYYQAASGTSGGSSGSPVIDIEGRVIALNAGGNASAATSFFLPLDRVTRALAALRRGEPVTRGTLQTVFVYRPYDELRRFGLREATERETRARFATGTGMLVVSEIVPEGPADGKLEPGDVLVRLDGKPIATFIPLDETLDARVGGSVQLDIERRGEPLRVELRVRDLHTITPSAYVEAGGGTFNMLSYQMARNFGLPVGGVFVADPGYALRRASVGSGTLLRSLAGRPTPDLESFVDVWGSLPDGARVPLRYVSLLNPRTEQVAVLEIDRRWFPLRLCRERPGGPAWGCEEASAAPPQPAPRARTARLLTGSDRAARALARSLVSVDFHVPFPVDGVHGLHFEGAGLIVDRERGLVVVDRETVPIAMGDILLSFGGSVRLPAELVYLHPEHNLAVVRYDPALLGDTPVENAVLRPGRLAVGEEVWLVGLSAEQTLVSLRTSVSRMEPLVLPLMRTPRFREMNLEVASLADSIPTVGGVLADSRGRVLALWASFSSGNADDLAAVLRGIPIERVSEITDALRTDRPATWRSLGVEWRALGLAEARERGLPEDAARRLEAAGGDLPRVLAVQRRVASEPAFTGLVDGDLLVEIDGVPVTRFADVERAVQRERLGLRVARGGELRDVMLEPRVLDGQGIARALVWAGAVLQAPHRAVAAQRGIEPRGVYVSFYFFGSPANRYGLRPTSRIIAVDGKPVADLDAFLAAVRGKRVGDSVQLRGEDLDGKPRVVNLELDLEYWPTYELRRTPGGWSRVSLSVPDATTVSRISPTP